MQIQFSLTNYEHTIKMILKMEEGNGSFHRVNRARFRTYVGVGHESTQFIM
jgi:hypothetical protein